MAKERAGHTPQPTKFVCAVCDQTRPLQADGKNNFVTSGGGNRICHGCVNAEDQRNLKDGKGITLSLVWQDGRWMAVNPTGQVKIPVQGGTPNMTDAQVLGSPTFEYNGRRWRGRFYPSSGTAHFVPVGVAHKGGGKTRAGAKGKAKGRSGTAAPASV